MKWLRNPFVAVSGFNFLLMLLIYLPYGFKPMQTQEIVLPGLWNLGLILLNFVIALIASFISEWEDVASVWWLNFGFLILFSFPACLATVALNNYFQAIK